MVTKKDIIEIVASQQNITKKEASENVNVILETISNALASAEKISLTGFGTFTVRERAARTGRNPRTGEVIEIKATKLVVFKAGKELKETLIK